MAPDYSVDNEFGSGALDDEQVLLLLERAVWIADDLRKFLEDPYNTDWIADVQSIADLINYEPPASDEGESYCNAALPDGDR